MKYDANCRQAVNLRKIIRLLGHERSKESEGVLRYQAERYKVLLNRASDSPFRKGQLDAEGKAMMEATK